MTNLEAQIKTVNLMNKNTIKLLKELNREFNIKKGTKILLKNNTPSIDLRRVREKVMEVFENNKNQAFYFYFEVSERNVWVKVRQMLKMEDNWYVYKDNEIHLVRLENGRFKENFNTVNVIAVNRLDVKFSAKKVEARQHKLAKLEQEIVSLKRGLKHFN